MNDGSHTPTLQPLGSCFHSVSVYPSGQYGSIIGQGCAATHDTGSMQKSGSRVNVRTGVSSGHFAMRISLHGPNENGSLMNTCLAASTCSMPTVGSFSVLMVPTTIAPCDSTWRVIQVSSTKPLNFAAETSSASNRFPSAVEF